MEIHPAIGIGYNCQICTKLVLNPKSFPCQLCDKKCSETIQLIKALAKEAPDPGMRYSRLCENEEFMNEMQNQLQNMGTPTHGLN